MWQPRIFNKTESFLFLHNSLAWGYVEMMYRNKGYISQFFKNATKQWENRVEEISEAEETD